MIYDDPNRPVYDPVRTANDSSAFGALLALLAIVAVLVVGTYLVAPYSGGTRTAVNSDTKPIPSAPAPSPGAIK
jgi:hypothetical protein